MTRIDLLASSGTRPVSEVNGDLAFTSLCNLLQTAPGIENLPQDVKPLTNSQDLGAKGLSPPSTWVEHNAKTVKGSPFYFLAKAHMMPASSYASQ